MAGRNLPDAARGPTRLTGSERPDRPSIAVQKKSHLIVRAGSGWFADDTD
jgi:hypothetical protein